MIKNIQKGRRGSAFAVILPLQSIKDHVRTIGIGCHKQRVMCLYVCSHTVLYIDRICGKHVSSSEQAGYSSINRHENNSHNNDHQCMRSGEIQQWQMSYSYCNSNYVNNLDQQLLRGWHTQLAIQRRECVVTLKKCLR